MSVCPKGVLVLVVLVVRVEPGDRKRRASSLLSLQELLRVQEGLLSVVADLSDALLQGLDVVSCYGDDIGCFESDGSIVPGLLPQPPDGIGTAFAAFLTDRPHRMQRLDDGWKGLPPLQKVAIIVHGYNATPRDSHFARLRDALLRQLDHELSPSGSRGAVVMVDWSRGSAHPHYLRASLNVEMVGRQVAALVNEMCLRGGLSPRHVHIIGFSLGAHVAGHAGKWAKKRFGFAIGRISALDPASPLFEAYGPWRHVWRDDADFVDAIHTSAGFTLGPLGDFGMKKPVGHVDFYPNGGTKQPHCLFDVRLNCSHEMSVEYYIASLSTPPQECVTFVAYPCPNYRAFLADRCPTDPSSLGIMGYYSDRAPGRGTLYLKVPTAWNVRCRR